MNPRTTSILILALATIAAAQCAFFNESLDSTASIQANGGTVMGGVSFIPGVNETAASFTGSGAAMYSTGPDSPPSGAICFWIKKNSSDAQGGILQLGTLGQPDSIGFFYTDTTNLIVEMRNTAGDLVAVYEPDILSESDWTHVVATWKEVEGGCHLWLFINGNYATYGWLPGTFIRGNTSMSIGFTGFYGFGHCIIDEVRIIDHNLSDYEVSAELVISSNKYRNQPTGKPVSTGPVQVIGKSLYVNGMPFTVKGVGYQATPICAAPWSFSVYTDPLILARDVALLDEMNVNTIRTWGQPPDTMLLDAMYYNASSPIYTLLGYWVPVSGIDYADPAVIAYYENDFRNFIIQFKDHPGVLGWVIGNEVNLTLSGDDLANWYVFANRLAKVAYLEEGASYHPTIIDNGGLRDMGNLDINSDDVSLNYVDMWGHNTYFGWDAGCYFDYYDLFTAKPLVLTEYGIDAWDNENNRVYEDTHAEYLVHQWRQIRTHCTGGTIMAYSDEWWKDGHACTQDFGGYATHFHPDGYSNEEWYGIVACQDNGTAPDIMYPRQAYYDMATEYAANPGDFDSDSDVDLTDFAAFQSCFGEAPSASCQATFDFTADNVIDSADFLYFTQCHAGPDTPSTCLQ